MHSGFSHSLFMPSCQRYTEHKGSDARRHRLSLSVLCWDLSPAIQPSVHRTDKLPTVLKHLSQRQMYNYDSEMLL